MKCFIKAHYVSISAGSLTVLKLIWFLCENELFLTITGHRRSREQRKQSRQRASVQSVLQQFLLTASRGQQFLNVCFSSLY